MSWCARLMCIALLSPGLAHAERALVLPARSEQTLSETDRSALATAAQRALRARGIEPVPAADGDPCADVACLSARMRDAGASHALEVKIWRGPDGATSGVSVTLVRPSGEHYSEGARVEPAETVGAAVERAAAGAYERMQRGPGPWLEVAGQPAGAAITVDGQSAGSLPQRVRVTGGLHRVVVSQPGYEAFDQTVTVPRNPDALKQLAVVLQRELPAPLAQHEPTPAMATSPWNYVIAGAAAVTGAVLAIGPLRSAADDGDCGRVEDGRCTGVVDFGGIQAVQLAAAGLLFAGGVAFAVWAPLHRTTDDPMAGAAFSGRF